MRLIACLMSSSPQSTLVACYLACDRKLINTCFYTIARFFPLAPRSDARKDGIIRQRVFFLETRERLFDLSSRIIAFFFFVLLRLTVLRIAFFFCAQRRMKNRSSVVLLTMGLTLSSKIRDIIDMCVHKKKKKHKVHFTFVVIGNIDG